MIVKEEFLTQLRQLFTLNLYEVKIWTALLSRGVSTAGELSEIGDVPRSRTYDVLETLEKKGFIIMKLGKPIKYFAVEPQEVVERSKKYVQIQAKENVKKLDNLKGSSVLKELDLLHNQGVEFISASDLSSALRGRKNVYNHMETLLKKAKESVYIATSANGLIRKHEVLKDTLSTLNKKGVKVKIAAPVNERTAAVVKDLQNYATVKNMTGMDTRFCLVDKKDVMFMLMHDDKVHADYDVGVWVNTPFFAEALTGMFETAWNGMENATKTLKNL